MPCSLEIHMPNDILNVWKLLDPGGAQGFKKESNNQDVDITITKDTEHTILAITGATASYIAITPDGYSCKVTDVTRKKHELPRAKRGHRTSVGELHPPAASTAATKVRHAEEPESLQDPIVGTPDTMVTESPIRRSARIKTPVTNSDFVVPSKKLRSSSGVNIQEDVVINPSEPVSTWSRRSTRSARKTQRGGCKPAAEGHTEGPEAQQTAGKLPEISPEETRLGFTRTNEALKLSEASSSGSRASGAISGDKNDRLSDFGAVIDMSPLRVKSEPDVECDGDIKCLICKACCKTAADLKVHVSASHDMRLSAYNKLVVCKEEHETGQLLAMPKRKSVPVVRKRISIPKVKEGKKRDSVYRDIVVNDKNTPQLVKTVKPPRIKPPRAQYVIPDADLAALPDPYNGCLLCGKCWPEQKMGALRNHIYIVHKILYNDHAKVLHETGAASRREALDKLEADSKEQMLASGKHCPVCFVGCIKGSYLLNHIQCHADHPEYHAVVEQVRKQVEFNDLMTSLSQKKCAKQEKTGGEDDSKPDIQKPCCPVCSKTFDGRDGIRRHVKHTHKVSWGEFTMIMQLSEDEKRQKFESLREKLVPEATSKWSKKYIDAERQMIECVECAEFVSCKEYGLHLMTEHSDLADVDKVISRMEEVITESTYRAIHNFDVECPICQKICVGQLVIKHVENSHKNHTDYEVQLAEISRHVKQVTNVRRNKARDRRMALKIKHCCRFCNTRFQDLSSVSNHENYRCKMNKDTKPSYFCKYCGQRGTTEKWFKTHLKKHDLNGHNYICHICGRGYTSKSGLHMHQAKLHRKLTRFTCAVCGKKFYVSSHYKAHMLKHSADRNHQCDVCGKAFKSRACVHRHKRTVHMKKYTDQCRTCGHAIDDPECLKTHLCDRVKPQLPDVIRTSVGGDSISKDTSSNVSMATNPTSTTKFSTMITSQQMSSPKKVMFHKGNRVQAQINPKGKTNASFHHMPTVSMELVSGSSGLPKVYMKPVNPSKVKVISQGHVVDLNNQSTVIIQENPMIEKSGQIKGTNRLQTVILEPSGEISNVQTIQQKPHRVHVQSATVSMTDALDPSTSKADDSLAEIILAAQSVGVQQEQQHQYIQEVFVDDHGHVLGSGPGPSVSDDHHAVDPTRDADLQNIVLVKPGEDDSLNTVLELPSFIWMTNDSEHA